MKYRQIDNEDIINYLQTNQAFLKTLILKIERTSNNLTPTNEESKKEYQKILDEIKSDFDKSRQLED